MTLYWSLQTEEVWNQAKELGFLEGKQEFAMYPDEYAWMMDQMGKRLPNYKGEYPVWLWIKKPDMRSSGHFSSYTKCVRLTIELDSNDVLISDFEDWHIVLNNGFNADTEQEFDDFYAGKLSISKEESWERIFNLGEPPDPEWSGTRDWLQGVTGRIDLERIKKVEYFVTRKQAKF